MNLKPAWLKEVNGKYSLSHSHPQTLFFSPGLFCSLLTSLPDIAGPPHKIFICLERNFSSFLTYTKHFHPPHCLNGTWFSAFLPLQFCSFFHAPGPSRSKRKSDSPSSTPLLLYRWPPSPGPPLLQAGAQCLTQVLHRSASGRGFNAMKLILKLNNCYELIIPYLQFLLIHWTLHLQYLSLWLYLKIGSFKDPLLDLNDVIWVDPHPIWLVRRGDS